MPLCRVTCELVSAYTQRIYAHTDGSRLFVYVVRSVHIYSRSKYLGARMRTFVPCVRASVLNSVCASYWALHACEGPNGVGHDNGANGDVGSGIAIAECGAGAWGNRVKDEYQRYAA